MLMRYWSVQQELERQQLINYHNRYGLHSLKQPILYNITATILFGRKPAYFVESRLAIGLNMFFEATVTERTPAIGLCMF